MCEAKAYLLLGQREEELMEAVEEVSQEGGEIFISSIFGETKRLKGRLRSFSLVNHKILIEPLE